MDRTIYSAWAWAQISPASFSSDLRDAAFPLALSSLQSVAPAHSARAPRTPPLKSALGRTCISSSGPWMPVDGHGCGSGSGFGGAGVCLGTGSGTTSAALWKLTSIACDVGPGSATSCDLLFLIQTFCSAAPPALSPLASSADPDFSSPASQPQFSLTDRASHGSE